MVSVAVGPVEVGPIPDDANVGFVHPPGSIGMPELTANPLILNGRLALDPTPARDVIHGEPTLRHNFFQISVAKRVTQIPPDAQNDDHVLKVPPTEQRRAVLHRGTTLPNWSTAFCNRS
jgi:hypothetical protein